MRRASFSNPGSMESFHAAVKGTLRRRLSEQTILSLARGGSPPHYRLPPRAVEPPNGGSPLEGLGGSALGAPAEPPCQKEYGLAPRSNPCI
jgi:hypothetical protein